MQAVHRLRPARRPARAPALLALLLAALAALACMAPAASAAGESTEESSSLPPAAAPASEESSEESSEASSEESEHSKNMVDTNIPNEGGGQVTFVSSKNDFLHVDAAPKITDHFAAEEQVRKNAEEGSHKRRAEARDKTIKEHAEKVKLKEEQNDKERAEKVQKKGLAERHAKRLAEQKGKAAAQLRKLGKEAAKKSWAQREQAKKRESEARLKEAAIKRKKHASERRAKLERRRAEQQYKRTNIRLNTGWRISEEPYLRVKAVRHGRYCLVEGLVRGVGPSLVAFLPRNCRPAQGRLVMTGVLTDAESRVDVLPDGRLYSVAGTTKREWLSLNQITFDVRRTEGVSLHRGWTNYGHGFRSSALSREGGLCMLSGLLRGSGEWREIANAGGACRPRERLVFAGNNHKHITRLDVRNDGAVVYAGGYRDHRWVSLDGMVYLPGDGGRVLPLYNGWQHYGHGFRYARYARTGKICVLTGLVRATEGWKTHITTLPAECRPLRRLVFGVNVHNHNARVDVLADGRVVFLSRPSRYNWLSLSGIHFLANQ